MASVTERQKRLLASLVERYVEARRPVPSRELAGALGVSPATVRYDLQALEAEGYVEKPHVSAGRVPTAKAYRAYALSLLPPAPLPEATRRSLARALASAGHDWPRLAAQIAARLAGYPALLRLVPRDEPRVVQVHLTPLEGPRVLAVAVLPGGRLRQAVLELPFEPEAELLAAAERGAADSPKLSALQSALKGAFATARDERHVAGLAELLSEPEAQDPAFLGRVLAYLESPPGGPLTPRGGYNIRLEEGLAWVQAGFSRSGWLGELSLVGPERMRFPRALSVARTLSETLEEEG